MSLTPEDIRALVRAFESSDWDELSLQYGDTKLALTRTGQPPAGQAAPVAAAPVAAAPAPVAATPAAEPMIKQLPPVPPQYASNIQNGSFRPLVAEYISMPAATSGTLSTTAETNPMMTAISD